MSITIRNATLDDIDWLVPQLRAFADFFNSKRSLFGSEDFVRNGVSILIQNHLFYVAEKFGQPVGFITGIVGDHIWNPQIKVLVESFWWVDPAHRMSRAGLMLLNAFTDWGKAHVDVIQFTLEDHSPVNDKTLIKRGFHLKERNYTMEIT